MDDKLEMFLRGDSLRICKVTAKAFYEAMSDVVPFFERVEKTGPSNPKAFEKHCNQAIEHYYTLALDHIPYKKKEGYFYICLHGSNSNISITYTTTLLNRECLKSAYDHIETYGFDEYPNDTNFEEIHSQTVLTVLKSLDDIRSVKDELKERLMMGNCILVIKNTTPAARKEIVKVLNEEVLKDVAIINKTELRKISIASYSAIHFVAADVRYAGIRNQKDIDTLSCLYDKGFLIEI